MLGCLHNSLMNLCPSHTTSIIPTIIQSIEFILGSAIGGHGGTVKVQVLHGDNVAVQMMMMLPLGFGLRRF
jgi:hypothetical protein